MGATKEYEAQIETSKQYEAQLDANTDSPSPPPYSSTTGSQIFDVNYRHWTSEINILDTTGQQVFLSEGSYCSTHVNVLDRSRQVIGHTKSSNFTSKIKVEIGNPHNPGSAFEIHNTVGALGGSPKYHSPAFGGQEMVWKNKAMSRKIVYELFDSHGTSFARFQSNPKTKIGKLELGDVAGDDRINEIAVILLTLLHRKMRNIEIGTIAAIT